MKDQIINNLENPRKLEKLYRSNKTAFKRSFNQIYEDIQEKDIAQVWNERLNYDQEDISWGKSNELIFIIVTTFIAGLIAKIPQLTSINETFFYPRNISFIVFPFLTAYFAWKQKISLKKLISISAIILTAAIYINLLPDNSKSDTLILACIHLPLFLWAVLGFMFAGGALTNYQKRLDFLRYNGDLAVMTAILTISGIILTGITLGLFALIDLKIEDFYFQNIAVWGIAGIPILATYLVQTNPQLVGRVSPIVARIFTPIVLLTLTIYLIAVIYTGKDPYNDREFLLIFNALLIGVMAIILFSVAEAGKSPGKKTELFLLFSLSVITVIVNGIALSAILFRITEWGITPNRLAVLGGNILILINLLIVTYRLFKTFKHGHEIENVEKSIATFLPIYSAWTIIVTFLFPVLFGFK